MPRFTLDDHLNWIGLDRRFLERYALEYDDTLHAYYVQWPRRVIDELIVYDRAVSDIWQNTEVDVMPDIAGTGGRPLHMPEKRQRELRRPMRWYVRMLQIGRRVRIAP